MKIKIYTKAECGLCDDAKEVIHSVRLRIPFELEEVDIESDPSLFERFKYDIPVVFVDERKVFKHRLTVEQLEARLRKGSARSVAQSPDSDE